MLFNWTFGNWKEGELAACFVMKSWNLHLYVDVARASNFLLFSFEQWFIKLMMKKYFWEIIEIWQSSGQIFSEFGDVNCKHSELFKILIWFHSFCFLCFVVLFSYSWWKSYVPIHIHTTKSSLQKLHTGEQFSFFLLAAHFFFLPEIHYWQQ